MNTFLIGYGLLWTVVTVYFVIVRGVSEYRLHMKKGRCEECAKVDSYINTANQNMKMMAQQHEELLTTLDSLIKENTTLKKKVSALVGLDPNTTVN